MEERIRTWMNTRLFLHDLKRSFTLHSVTDTYFLLTWDASGTANWNPQTVAEFHGGIGKFFANYDLVEHRMKKLERRSMPAVEEKKAITEFMRKRLTRSV